MVPTRIKDVNYSPLLAGSIQRDRQGEQSLPVSRELEPKDQSKLVSLPSIANLPRLIIFLLALAVVASTAFVAGLFVRAPQQDALDAASQRLEVTYPVEERSVSPGIVLASRVVAGTTSTLTPMASSSRAVVTKSALKIGTEITPGTWLGEVSGRPLFAIPTDVPLYRDLMDGSTGSDVSALQSALQSMGLDVSVTGEVGSRTLAGVAELYSRAGAEMTSRDVISWTEFLPVAPGAIVLSSAPVGAVITDETSLATVQVSPDVVVGRANVLEADELSVGQPVQIRSSTATAQSTILAIGEFSIPEDNSGAGRDVTISIPDGFQVSASEPVTISLEQVAEPQPAVPVIALRQDATGTYVELPDSAATSSASPNQGDRKKVYVTVIAQADGWAAIDSNGKLTVGDLVHVSP